MDKDTIRPPQAIVSSRDEFERWYWPVELLHAFCDRLSLPRTGRKHEIRARVSAALAGEQAPVRQSKSKVRENWGKMPLSLNTRITDGITFGPNVRGFFKSQIGKTFVCHADFMDWVRSNTGATLGDAVHAWGLLEARKQDPAFRREIASCNNFLQYVRDARDANPKMTLDQAKACWDYKKVRQATRGRVIYDKSDLRCLEA